MNKQELIAATQNVIQDRRNAKSAVESLLTHIHRSLQKGDAVTLSGFGTFKVVERKARTGRNPKTGETIAIPAHRAVRFIPGKGLRDAVSD